MAGFLIVDDSFLMRKTLKLIIEKLGHHVVGEAADGLDAYEKYGLTTPDGVIMDIEMPKMNGIDSIKKIIADFKDAKILVVSTHNEKNLIVEALKNGAKYYLIKPVTEDSLKKGIEILFK
ncbi:MAG: response regulator transcription factor [Brevinematales bacterium]|nr:response regulator transcription factor [Brevinematales bacterium]